MRLERAERRWSGRCIVAASGPSLTQAIADQCGGQRIVAVNDAYRLFPFADVLYACDAGWYDLHAGCRDFRGERWTSHSLSPKNDKTMVADRLGLRVIEGRDGIGFSRDPAHVHYANNSGFQAVNLALLWGADPVVLVGFDMRAIDKRTHFFGNHKAPLRDGGQYGKWAANFAKAAEMLWHPRPTIINATPGSALTCFPIMSLAEALAVECERDAA